MRPRVLLLFLAAAVIVGLCAWRVRRDAALLPSAGGEAVVLRAAPLFIGYDTHKPPRMVRLSSYAGRHRILLVFFDGRQGFDRDPLIRRLHDAADELNSQDVRVFAVSDALPQTNRAILEERYDGELPRNVEILSDPTFAAQQLYGVHDRKGQRTRPAAFLIDRAGRVRFNRGRPEPLADPQAALREIASNE
jgi:peroxiredoxin